MKQLARVSGLRANCIQPLLIASVLAVLTSAFIVGCNRPRLDENLCPIGQPVGRNTILLLDTSDRLTVKHRAELRRLVTELQAPSGSQRFHVAPGDALIVYELTPDLAALEPVIKVCNPGDRPDDWGWRQELTQGKQIALRQWQRFRDSVEPLFAHVQSDAVQSRSPIIETLGVIVPRHAPSRRTLASTDGGHTHLIVFSDLLQHSDALSHYGPYPPGAAVRKTAGLRHLQTDLTGVDVSLFRLERSQNARWQTRDHYYWWTELIEAFGGRVVWQESM